MGLRGTTVCLALVGAVAGCGWISGLDNLSVDASTNGDDASEAGADDSADTNEAGPDGESADASCALTMSEMGCFGSPSCNDTCCLTATGGACTNICSGIAFGCTSPSECLTSDAGDVCCLTHVVEPAGQLCPYALTAMSGGTSATKTTATCVSAASCSGTAGENVRMCSDNAECPLAETCVKATLSTDPSVIFGVCQ